MPQDTLHPQYIENCEKWKTITDVLGGEEAVKAAGERYLPKLPAQDTEEYQAYLQRGSFFNATGRTQAALIGFLFRKDPMVKPDIEAMQGQSVLAEFIADATMTGKSLYDLAKDDIGKSVTGSGRCVTLIDWSEEEMRPFVVFYPAHEIINWKYETLGGRLQLTMLMLHELSPIYVEKGDGEKPGDRYEQIFYDQWREWSLESDAGEQRYVVVKTWRRKKGVESGRSEADKWAIPGTGPAPGVKVRTGKPEFIAIDTYYPKRGGTPLDFIPAVFHSPRGPMGDEICHPILLDMANVNLSHYRTKVDLKNVLHVLGAPTLCLTGVDEESDELEVGIGRAVVSSNASAKVYYAELSANGLSHLTEDLLRDEKEMAALGARMLDTQHAAGSAEAYETVALRQSGEISVLMSVSLSETQSMTDLLAIAYWWTNRGTATVDDAEEKVEYIINSDFTETTLDGPTLSAYVSAYIQGAISFETLFYNLQQAEIIPGDHTVEEERDMIEQGHQSLIKLGAIPDPNEPAPGEKDITD